MAAGGTRAATGDAGDLGPRVSSGRLLTRQDKATDARGPESELQYGTGGDRHQEGRDGDYVVPRGR